MAHASGNLGRRLVTIIVTSLMVTLVACQTTTTKIEPKNNVAIGNQYAKDGLLREAAESYKKALASKPKNSTAHRNLGMVLVKMGDYKAAARHLEKAMPRFDQDFDANFYLGEAYRAQDKYAEAIFRYKKSLKIKDDEPRALKPLAWSYFKIRYYSEAMTVARTLQKVAPEDEQTSIIVARTQLKLKRPKDALITIAAAKKTASTPSKPYYASVEGDIFYDLGRQEEATRAYREALKDQPLLPGALLGLGRSMLVQGKTSQAISYMERAVRIRPRLTEAHYLLGKAYEGVDKKKALRYYTYFRRQAATDPEFVSMLNEVNTKMSMLQQTDKKTKG